MTFTLRFSNFQLCEPQDVSRTLHQQAIITTPFCAHFLQNRVSRLRFPSQPGNTLHAKKVNIIFHASSSHRAGAVKAKAAGAACSQGAGIGAAPRRVSVLGIGSHFALQMGFKIPILSGARGRLLGLTHPAAHCSSRHLVALMLSQFGEQLKEPGKSRGVMETHGMSLRRGTQPARPAEQLGGLGARSQSVE